MQFFCRLSKAAENWGLLDWYHDLDLKLTTHSKIIRCYVKSTHLGFGISVNHSEHRKSQVQSDEHVFLSVPAQQQTGPIYPALFSCACRWHRRQHWTEVVIISTVLPFSALVFSEDTRHKTDEPVGKARCVMGWSSRLKSSTKVHFHKQILWTRHNSLSFRLSRISDSSRNVRDHPSAGETNPISDLPNSQNQFCHVSWRRILIINLFHIDSLTRRDWAKRHPVSVARNWS